MKTKTIALTLSTCLAALHIGCTPQQMARIEHNMEVAKEKAAARKHACAEAADRRWNLYPGTAYVGEEKFTGGGIYDVKVTGPSHKAICTVTETGMVEGMRHDDGEHSGKHHGGGNSAGSEYERGCADAKAGSYDRSGNAGRAYEDGWNSCKH